eukprot:1160322-Pelagomonas_calceolata.AAC.5
MPQDLGGAAAAPKCRAKLAPASLAVDGGAKQLRRLIDCSESMQSLCPPKLYTSATESATTKHLGGHESDRSWSDSWVAWQRINDCLLRQRVHNESSSASTAFVSRCPPGCSSRHTSLIVCRVYSSAGKAAVFTLQPCPAVRPAAAIATHHSSCVVSIRLLVKQQCSPCNRVPLSVWLQQLPHMINSCICSSAGKAAVFTYTTIVEQRCFPCGRGPLSAWLQQLASLEDRTALRLRVLLPGCYHIMMRSVEEVSGGASMLSLCHKTAARSVAFQPAKGHSTSQIRKWMQQSY